MIIDVARLALSLKQRRDTASSLGTKIIDLEGQRAQARDAIEVTTFLHDGF